MGDSATHLEEKPEKDDGDTTKPIDKTVPSLPEGGLEKSAAIESKLPRPGTDVEEEMGRNMDEQAVISRRL